MSRNRHKKVVNHHSAIFLIVLAILIGAIVFSYTRPLPLLYPKIDTVTPSVAVSNPIVWPTSQEAAIGANGFGILAVYGVQKQIPIASVAKLITALTVLQKYPLALSQPQTPAITLTNADVAIYNQYVAEQGSVVNIVSGEQISEYQALEAMLIPSANNMADSLAIWAYGSLPNYVSAANQYIKSIGLTQTTIGTDASGFLPSTTSTAHDLILIGFQALNNPVITQIVDQTQVTLPVAGVVKNYDWLLGNNGIIGIKTGNTHQAGGVYVFAATDKIAGSPTSNIEIVGSIEGTATLQDALNDTPAFLNSIKANFYSAPIINSREVVGHYKIPWGKTINAVSLNNISSPLWRGTTISPIISLQAIYAPLNSGTSVGVVEVPGQISNTKSSIVLQQPVPAVPWWWRIIRHKL
jgi:D-alanyl-D-alanine carboxypeptidase (penicillin-binding protein 5/6)